VLALYHDEDALQGASSRLFAEPRLARKDDE